MPFRVGYVVKAAGADPSIHRAKLSADTLELTVRMVDAADWQRVIAVCKNLVEEEQVDAITLCPGFSHAEVGRIAEAVGSAVAIDVARSDARSAHLASRAMQRAESQDVLGKDPTVPKR